VTHVLSVSLSAYDIFFSVPLVCFVCLSLFMTRLFARVSLFSSLTRVSLPHVCLSLSSRLSHVCVLLVIRHPPVLLLACLSSRPLPPVSFFPFFRHQLKPTGNFIFAALGYSFFGNDTREIVLNNLGPGALLSSVKVLLVWYLNPRSKPLT